jgi:hypothetical protein
LVVQLIRIFVELGKETKEALAFDEPSVPYNSIGKPELPLSPRALATASLDEELFAYEFAAPVVNPMHDSYPASHVPLA